MDENGLMQAPLFVFGMWLHTVMHGRGSEGETGKWSG